VKAVNVWTESTLSELLRSFIALTLLFVF